MRLEGEGSDEASARGGQFEILDGEREVVIVRIVDQEAVVDVLLEALGLVAGGHQRAGLSAGVGVAFLDAGVLVEFDSVGLDFVDDDAPLAVDVDGAQRLDVGSGARAEVSLLFQFGQSVDRVGRVDGHVLVQGQDGLVVLVESVDDFVGRVLRVLQTPGFGRVLGAGRHLRLVFRLVRWHSLVRSLVSRVAGHGSHDAHTEEDLRQ